MRVRPVVLLIALLAIAVLPSESALVEQAGSVVDQVTSCTQPSGLARELGADTSACSHRVPSDLGLGVVAVLVAALGALGGAAPEQLTGRRARKGRGWRPTEALARAGAPRRGPPAVICAPGRAQAG